VNAVVCPASWAVGYLKDIISEGHMNGTDMCFICRGIDSHANLGVWFVGNQRIVVHLECWLAWYEQRSPRGKAPGRDPSPPGQRDSEQAS
jgi:hypothetical protein